ncbi:hypothetical protein LX69_01856 [Breznakibacter xylanolyticus]|uniref:Uncharacterized protein n=1 Tax=Breznakibacter xylanolyticus TaxID=990 RepID=A0A2W7NYU2_9BACT|nr:hypothetical protein [Breznakibacter xylanolyticus]MBN2744073.1 hypothetical protein [Marinilabiliaceae bacterium]PZX16362.1 hypothetical protein LX69_01856 [Breznakibacter xylanolyticus]
MKFTREDYNRRIIDVDGKIPDDEPVFLLRAQDKFASLTLKKYCEFLEQEAEITHNTALMEMAKELRAHAHDMLMWKYSHVPDKPASK